MKHLRAQGFFKFTRGNSNDMAHTRKEIDLKEQIANAFFGLENLLNFQPGGIYASYQPTRNDYQHFRSKYHLKFFEIFNRYARQTCLIKLLRPWLEKISETENRIDKPMSTDMRSMLQTQAEHRRIMESTVLLLVDSDITCSNYRHGRQFFQTSRAGVLTKDILIRH